jgi:hypothetical protein
MALTEIERHFPEFKLGGLLEKHAVVIWNLAAILAFI